MSSGKVQADRSLLKAARVKLGLDQRQLAQAAGLTGETISNFETGRHAPQGSTRLAIQTALEVRGIVFTNGDRPGFYYDKDRASIPT